MLCALVMIFLISNSIYSYGFSRKKSYSNNIEEVLKFKGRLPTPLSRFIKSSDNKKLCGDIYLNEVNTIPGFTNISMFPKMFMSSGVSYTKLVSELLELAQL